MECRARVLGTAHSVLPDQVCQGDVLQRRLDDAADLLPGFAYGAATLVLAACGTERAIRERERPLEHADHLGDREFVRLTGEPVAALGAALRGEQPFFCERLQDLADHRDRKVDLPASSRAFCGVFWELFWASFCEEESLGE